MTKSLEHIEAKLLEIVGCEVCLIEPDEVCTVQGILNQQSDDRFYVNGDKVNCKFRPSSVESIEKINRLYYVRFK